MKYLPFLILPIILLGLVAYSQTSISAQPLYLSVLFQYPFTVFNVINTTYVGWHYKYVNQTIANVAINTYIQIILKNYTTGQVVATLTAYFPASVLQYMYYSPQWGSVIFFINVSGDKVTQLPISLIQGLPPLLLTYNGQPTTTVAIIPLGYLMCANGMPVNQSTVFQKYLNGNNEIVADMEEGLAGYYVLYFTT